LGETSDCDSTSTVGAAVNAVTVAELCAGDRHPDKVEADLRNWGMKILDVPAAAASICGQAHRCYTLARRASGGGMAPKFRCRIFSSGRMPKS